jgi:hypothetical protein
MWYDTEFVALTEHIRGKFWSGDKALQKGLKNKGWNKFISTDELSKMIKLNMTDKFFYILKAIDKLNENTI